MSFFRSDNIWRKRERAQHRLETMNPEEIRREDERDAFINEATWLFGAAFLGVLCVVCLAVGIIAVSVYSLVFTAVLLLYALVSAPKVCERYRQYRKNKGASQK